MREVGREVVGPKWCWAGKRLHHPPTRVCTRRGVVVRPKHPEVVVLGRVVVGRISCSCKAGGGGGQLHTRLPYVS